MSAFNNKVFNRVIVPISFVSSLVGGTVLIKEYKGGRKCPSKEQMKGKVCVVTGANSGIGKCTAEELARRGATVVMGCRHMGKCEKAARSIRMSTENANVVCKFIDLAAMDTIEEFAENVRNELPHIDVLVNNAGVMKPRKPFTTTHTTDNFERQFGVNYLGHFLLTNLLLDRLTNGTTPGRVISLSSDAYQKGEINLEDIEKSDMEDNDEKLTELYYQSKLAVMLFTDSLSRRFNATQEGSGIVANAVNPGITSTQIGRHSKAPIYAIGMHLYRPFSWLAMKTPVQGSQTSVYLTVSSDMEGKTGSYYDDCAEVCKISDKCDSTLADRLWEKSEQWTNLGERLERVREKEAQNTRA